MIKINEQEPVKIEATFQVTGTRAAIAIKSTVTAMPALMKDPNGAVLIFDELRTAAQLMIDAKNKK